MISRSLPGEHGFLWKIVFPIVLNYSTEVSKIKSSSMFPPKIKITEIYTAALLISISRAPLLLITIEEILVT